MKGDPLSKGGILEDFWAGDEKELASALGTSAEGLTSGDADRRLKDAGAGDRKAPGTPPWLPLFHVAVQ